MTAFALVHGGWHGGWCWQLVQAELAARGHTSVAPDLPITDPAAGAVAYADAVLAALPAEPVVLVAHSLAGLVAPLVAAAAPVRRVVYLAAMLPEPGRSVDDRARAGQRMTRPRDRPRPGGQRRRVDVVPAGRRGRTALSGQPAGSGGLGGGPAAPAALAGHRRAEPGPGAGRGRRPRTCGARRTGSSTRTGPGPRCPSRSSCPATTARSWPGRPSWPTCWSRCSSLRVVAGAGRRPGTGCRRRRRSGAARSRPGRGRGCGSGPSRPRGCPPGTAARSVCPGSTSSVSVHHGLPVAAAPSRETTSAWWPCRCIGWFAVDGSRSSSGPARPSRTVKTGPSGQTRPFIDHW